MLGKHGLVNLDEREAPLLQGGYIKSFFKKIKRKWVVIIGPLGTKKRRVGLIILLPLISLVASSIGVRE